MSNGDVVNLVVALGGWIVLVIVAIYQIKQNQEQKYWESIFEIEREKLRKINAHLDSYSELIEIYRLYGRQTDYLIKDEDGNFVLDKNGEYITGKTDLEPEERFERALQNITKTDLRSALAQKIVSIRLKNGEVGDLLNEIDPSGALNTQLGKLFLRTVNSSEDAIASNDFMEVFNALNEADQLRLELRMTINSNFSKKLSKRGPK